MCVTGPTAKAFGPQVMRLYSTPLEPRKGTMFSDGVCEAPPIGLAKVFAKRAADYTALTNLSTFFMDSILYAAYGCTVKSGGRVPSERSIAGRLGAMSS